jgi:tetratricopeptide (TPR) repeat protein
LALRWLGRSEEAAATYRGLVKAYPQSPQGVRGLVQALADGNRLADALDEAEEGLEKFPEDGELRIRQAQVLNWAGRHVQARRALEDLPPAFQETSDALQHRTLAARWASRPREAFELALEYRQKHPNDPRSERLLRELSYEYGTSVEVQADGVRDSNGYSYRSVLQRVTLPLSVSHRLGFLREKRNYEDEYAQPGEMSWNRYGVDWNGNLGRRVNAYGSLASLGYSQADTGRRWMGDASVSSLLTDQVVVAGGIGMLPAETLPALQERLIGWQTWGSARWRPTIKLEAGARYARRDFPDTTVRETAEFSGFYRLSQRGGHKIRLGGRSQWMWHDRWTPLFWSPQFFHTQLVSVHLEGSLPGRFDYVTEVGSGFQREAGYARQIPLVTTFELAKKLQPQLWLRVKAGYSNSSIDRINTGSGAYRFGYFSAGLDFRLGKNVP